MKTIRILLTGGGTGGHIYPLVAVAEALKNLAGEAVEIFYVGSPHSLNREFIDRGIKVKTILGGKLRRYFSLANLIDISKFLISLVQAWFLVLRFRPKVVFSKGGPGALPVVLTARFFGKPVIIHESDAVPGLTNRLSSRFAQRIAISFRSAAKFFPLSKTAWTGNPVRAEIFKISGESREIKKNFGFDLASPLVLVLGGSQGAQKLNQFILNNLESFLPVFQIFHQTGIAHYEDIVKQADIFLNSNPVFKNRYQVAGFLNLPNLKKVLAAADLVISRTGSGAIFEIAAAAKPAVLIPLPSAAQDHQTINAYEYAATGAAVVVEESNLKTNIVFNQIKDILNDSEKQKVMAVSAKNFAKPAAAEIIAREILKLAGVELTSEKQTPAQGRGLGWTDEKFVSGAGQPGGGSKCRRCSAY